MFIVCGVRVCIVPEAPKDKDLLFILTLSHLTMDLINVFKQVEVWQITILCLFKGG